MAFFSDKFNQAMDDAGLTRAQQEAVVEALSREPRLIAAITMESMDRGDFAAGHRA
jgi:hypothetical protein